jgi:hypothetical protein
MNARSEDLRQARADARADLVRRLFAVAVSIGFAATLAQTATIYFRVVSGP